MSEASDSASAPGATLGTVIDDRYRLEAVLGEGGFGVVYRAHHLELDRDVALKLLRVSELGPGAGKRLVREAKVLARLDHPACVRVSDAGTFSGAPYLVMELLAGKTLDALLGTPWPAMRAIETTLTLLGGLAHAHEQGLVHRDLKPGNVMVVDGQIKIIDFGVVAVAAGERVASFTEQLTATGKVLGTPRYMSPEQLLGTKLDGRSDLYAVGLMLFEMLTGSPPFVSEDPQQLAWLHATAPPPPLPDTVPDALAAFVERLLAKKPGQRPAGADAARRELEEIVPTVRDGDGLAKVTKVTSSLSQAPEATIDVTSDSTRDATRDLHEHRL